MKQREGWLLVDNRHAAVPMEVIAASGQRNVVGGSARLLEVATLTCSHCQTQLIRNPERMRDRAWCSRCDKYVCDGCKYIVDKTGVCVPMAKFIEDEATRIERALITGRL